MQAIGYVRVSTQQQADEGVSLEMQETKLHQWASLNDAELLAVQADEGLSGKTTRRPGLQAALAAAKRLKCALVVYSLSRLSRSTRDTLAIADELDAAGCDLVILRERVDTTSASGRMVFRMLAAINEFEREQLSERTSHAMQHMRAQGLRVGSIPHGYVLAGDGKRLVPNSREQGVLVLVKGLRGQGWTLQAISDELARQGAFNKRGAPFNPKSIRAMAQAA